MLKTVSAILLIATCLLMQYTKQFAYLQCKVENSMNTQPTCDCEKKYNDAVNTETGQLPDQKNHIHYSLDEFDVPGKNSLLIFETNKISKIINRNSSFISSYSGNIFHPPQL